MSESELRELLGAYAAGASTTDPRPGLQQRLAGRRRARVGAVAWGAAIAVVAVSGVVVLAARERRDDRLVATDPVTAQAGGPSGLRLSLTLAPGSPRADEETVLEVRAEDDDGTPYLSSISWGDGAVDKFDLGIVECFFPPRPAGVPQPGELTKSLRHSWRIAGEVSLVATVKSPGGPCQGDVPAEAQTVTLDFVVAEGSARSNGPALPRSEDATTASGDFSRDFGLQARIEDPDGYVKSATIDWGDGTTTTVENDQECDDDDGDRYPRGVWRVLSGHTYPDDRRYVPVISYISTGCDGNDAQAGRTTVELYDEVNPGREPHPQTSITPGFELVARIDPRRRA